MANERHPIIAHGELYVEPISKKSTPVNKSYPHEYEEAKTQLISNIDKITSTLSGKNVESREIFIDEKIICLRMEPKFEAKSYIPNSIINSKNDMELIGGRKYSTDDEDSAKLYFVKTSGEALQKLKQNLEEGTNDHNKSWKNQICSLRSVDLLSPDEKVLGFDDDWQDGSVEIVLHPIGDNYQKAIDTLFELSNIPSDNALIRTYENGLTFISTTCSKEQLEAISNLNVLRTVHPLGRINAEPLRVSVPGFNMPTVEYNNKISPIKVGVFDGGANENHPLLKNFVSCIDATAAAEHPKCVDHGTGVCGIILHGNIAGKSGKTLPTPSVSVDCYRVLPLLDKGDIELYEVIDAIENIVPGQKDTKLFNLSMGPAGAIVDDSISRFTYVLDKLTYDVDRDETNPLFSIAVGNDGDLVYPLNRIQAPSDMVNGLAVGSYTYDTTVKKIRAPYSCIGEGREGGKIKPDILDFGGSFDHPFIVASNDTNQISGVAGTSFASPLAVHKIGSLMAQSQNISPHLGRALLIHTAEYDKKQTKLEQGFGFCQSDVDNILTCEDNDVTLLYSGTLMTSQTAKLPIFAPRINTVPGNVKIKWTVATIVNPCINDPDAYTSNCIEDTFVPHDMTFNFTKKGYTPHKINMLNSDSAELVQELVNQGYTRSEHPVSHPAKRNWDEKDLRNKDLKWDTIISKQLSMRSTSLSSPYLALHAIGRNDFKDDKIRYFAVISISAPKFEGSLYNAILQSYRNLAPIEIRNINRILVSNNT